MQQRRGRPSGTDGSDFSYRMVVDSVSIQRTKTPNPSYLLVRFGRPNPAPKHPRFSRAIAGYQRVADGISRLARLILVQIMKQNTADITSYEMFDVVRVALGVLLQLVVIATTTRLLQNMSPPKRTS
ncbi:hypothetical protein ZWY2020_042342 [Hordeum vulgare]|nr:hypothetical protein ZWY2020_042342 [Hordeum vulgare]